MENKIRTILPYNMDIMDEIRTNGAIVDMSQLRFPNVDDEMMIKVVFIFLRNTDYPVDYDFSNCSFEMKTKYLMTYLTDAVDYKMDILVQSWMAILCYSLGIVLEDKGILNQNEIKQFIEENLDFIGELIHFFTSLPVYALSRYEFNNEKIVISDIPTNTYNKFNDNIIHLMYNNAMNIVLESETDFEPMNYTHYFTETNDKLFAALQEYPYMAILVGLTDKEPSEWDNFLKEYNDFIGTSN